MKYTRAEAKSHSRATMRGVWAAANVPFRDDGAIDEEGYRRNMEHWIADLHIGRRAQAHVRSFGRGRRGTKPPEKPCARQKYWQELLGQTGGRVRSPLLELTGAEKRATRGAFEACGLNLG